MPPAAVPELQRRRAERGAGRCSASTAGVARRSVTLRSSEACRRQSRLAGASPRRRRRILPTISPSYMTRSCPERQDLIELDDRADRSCLVALFHQAAVHELDRSDVEPAVGCRRQQHAGIAADLAREDTFCWFPPDSARPAWSARRRGRRTGAGARARADTRSGRATRGCVRSFCIVRTRFPRA